MTTINLIWAEDLNGWIGQRNRLPWHVSADLRHFRKLTTGHPIVMGKNTYESMGNRPLPHRQNLVLTHQDLANDQITIFHSFDDIQQYLQQNPADYFIIGGARIYQQFLPLATDLYRTVINQHVNGDTKMPAIDYHRWHLVDRKPVQQDRLIDCWFEHWNLDVKQD